MNKKIMIIALFLIVAVPVLAIQIGAVITQEQLDSYNISSMDLDGHFVKDNGNVVYDCYRKKCNFYVEFKIPRKIMTEVTFEKQYQEFTGEYEIVEISKTIKKDMSYYLDLRVNYSRSDVIEILTLSLIKEKNNIIDSYKKRIETLQTPVDEDVEDLISGLEL